MLKLKFYKVQDKIKSLTKSREIYIYIYISVIRCLFLLVELFFIGLGLGNSRLVIPSLLFFAPFLCCNFSVVWFSIVFVHCSLFLVLSRLALCFSCIEQPFIYIYIYIYIFKHNDYVENHF